MKPTEHEPHAVPLLGKVANDADAKDLPYIPPWVDTPVKSSQHRRSTLVASISSSVLSIVLMFGLFAAFYNHQRSQPLLWDSFIGKHRPGTVFCGNSSEEAKLRGCTFDELSMLWIPQKCTQRYNQEYMVANDGGPFSYWTDRRGRDLLDSPALHVGNGTFFWTSRRNHIVHCQYNLYRLADSLKTGSYIGHDDGQTLSDHLHHCVMTMTEFALKAPNHELDVTDVITEPGFGYC